MMTLIFVQHTGEKVSNLIVMIKFFNKLNISKADTASYTTHNVDLSRLLHPKTSAKINLTYGLR